MESSLNNSISFDHDGKDKKDISSSDSSIVYCKGSVETLLGLVRSMQAEKCNKIRRQKGNGRFVRRLMI